MKIVTDAILFLYVIIIIGCTTKERSKDVNSEKGFNLQEFVITEKELQSVVNDITSIFNNDPPSDIYTLTLELREYKYTLEFWFNVIKKESVTKKIFSYNKRIVGYVTCNNKDIIVLSDINDRLDFEIIFYKFIQPTENNKRFNFIYFDDTQYQVDEQGNFIPSSSGIRDHYVAYIFQDNKMIVMEDEEWYYDRILR